MKWHEGAVTGFPRSHNIDTISATEASFWELTLVSSKVSRVQMGLIEVSLATFLRSGALGPIRRGMSFREVTRLVGSPGDLAFWDRPERGPSVAWYGSIELGFSTRPPNRIHYIQIEHSHHSSGGFAGYRRLRLDDDGFNPCTGTLEGFERFARKNNISILLVSPPWSSDDQVCFLTRGGVVAWFSGNSNRQTSFDTFITENPTRFTASHKPFRFVRDESRMNVRDWLSHR